jgi:hypothetical protein
MAKVGGTSNNLLKIVDIYTLKWILIVPGKLLERLSKLQPKTD